MNPTQRVGSGRSSTFVDPGVVWSAVFSVFGNRITVPHDADFDLTDPLTIEAWLWIASETPSGFPVAITKGAVNSAYQIFYSNTTKNLTARIEIGAVPFDATAAMPGDQWVHIAAVYNGATIKLYMNSVEVASTPAAGNIDTNALPLFFGDGSLLGNNIWYGMISDLRLWNVARSQAEIAANMNQRIAPQVGLVGYWYLNDGPPGRIIKATVDSPVKDGTPEFSSQWSAKTPF